MHSALVCWQHEMKARSNNISAEGELWENRNEPKIHMWLTKRLLIWFQPPWWVSQRSDGRNWRERMRVGGKPGVTRFQISCHFKEEKQRRVPASNRRKVFFLWVLFCDFSFPSVINEKAEMTGSLSCLIFICRITRWGCKVRSRKAEAGFIFQFRQKRPAENKLHPV